MNNKIQKLKSKTQLETKIIMEKGKNIHTSTYKKTKHILNKKLNTF